MGFDLGSQEAAVSMDFSIKPSTAPAVAPSPSAVAIAVNDAVKTELRAPLTVTAVDAPAYARNDPRTAADSVSRQIVVDQASASFVYQTIDKRTNEVIAQFPDDAILRRRAFFEALDRQMDLPQPEPVDRSI